MKKKLKQEQINLIDRIVANEGIFKDNQLFDGKMVYFYKTGECEIVFIDKGRKTIRHYYNKQGQYVYTETF